MQISNLRRTACSVFGGLFFFAVTSCVYSQDTAPSETISSQAPSAPQIVIHSPTPDQKVNASKLLVKGEITDDGEVASIIIGDVSLGVSGSRIPFQYPVYLKKGKNEIRVEAMDSQGNKSVKTITVFSVSKTAQKPVKVSAPVAVSKTSQKSEAVIPAIPDLPSKPIIVKKENYVKITSTLTTLDEGQGTPDGKYLVNEEKTDSSPKKIVVSKAHKKTYYGQAKTGAAKKKKTVSQKRWNASQRWGRYVSITPRVLVNDRALDAAVKPVLHQGRTYVALEDDFASKISAQVVHDLRGGRQYVYLTAKGRTVKLTVSGGVLYSNGNAVTLDAPLRTKQGRLMIPFRVVCEEMGFYVSWDALTHTASAHQH